jgi:hypothetical protein
MYVEILDGRYAGQMRDMEPGAAMDLINVGRAKRYGEPTLATPPLPGGYRGTSTAEPLAVVRLDEPTDKPLVAWNPVDKKATTLATRRNKK